MAVEAVDRAMRGQTSPSPIYEGEDGVIAWMLDGPDASYDVPLPAPGEPKRAILDSYTKEHSAEYQAQAWIDLARKLHNEASFDPADVASIVLHTSHHTHYVIGSTMGPHPFPMMVRDFQTVIGKECIDQMPEMAGRQPDYVIACVGGGSNAMGIFHPYIPHESVKLIGVEAAGEGMDTNRHSASLQKGRPGVLHGNRTYLLQDEDGQIIETHSISAGLDYPGVGPEHAWLHEIKRVEYVPCTDDEALQAFHQCCRLEGIIPALESAHALAEAFKRAAKLPKEHLMVVNLSGRGDKDMQTVMHHMSEQEKHA